MKITVCIKSVKTELIYPNENRNEKFLMNPYDLFALEACLELKKQIDCEIICICMGPKGAEEVLRKSLAMGADEAVLLNDAAFGGSDTVATTYILSKAIQKIGKPDLIVCGGKAIDGETGQVAIGISERMGYSCITQVKEIVGIANEKIVLNYQDNAMTYTIKTGLPTVVVFCDFKTTQPNISLLKLKKSKNKKIEMLNLNDLEADVSRCGLNGSKTKVLNVKNELIKKEKTIVEGTSEEKAKLILQLIKS